MAKTNYVGGVADELTAAQLNALGGEVNAAAGSIVQLQAGQSLTVRSVGGFLPDADGDVEVTIGNGSITVEQLGFPVTRSMVYDGSTFQATPGTTYTGPDNVEPSTLGFVPIDGDWWNAVPPAQWDA